MESIPESIQQIASRYGLKASKFKVKVIGAKGGGPAGYSLSKGATEAISIEPITYNDLAKNKYSVRLRNEGRSFYVKSARSILTRLIEDKWKP